MSVFLELSGKQLTDYLSVRGVAWILLGGEKWNWLRRAFLLVAAMMELKLDIIQSSSENQSNLSQSNFEKKKKWRNPEFLILKQWEKMQLTMLQNDHKLH